MSTMNTANIRRWHSYLGLFMAPSVLFFTMTGAAQLFSLHEAHDQYQPPMIVEKLSSVHKDQVFAQGHHHDDAGGDAAAPAAAESDDKPKPATFALKVFFLFTACCLVLSTALGLWMGFTQIRRTRTAWILLLAGALIPTGLLLL